MPYSESANSTEAICVMMCHCNWYLCRLDTYIAQTVMPSATDKHILACSQLFNVCIFNTVMPRVKCLKQGAFL